MFKCRRFPVEIISVCVRWYCKYGISYRDLTGLCCIKWLKPSLLMVR